MVCELAYQFLRSRSNRRFLTTGSRIGQDKHVMTYCITGGKSFNMVLSHVDKSDPSTWDHNKFVEDMRSYFEGWDS